MTSAAPDTPDGSSLPPGWRWAKLGEVCDDNIATRDPARQPKGEFNYVDISSVDAVMKCIANPKRLASKDAPSRARQIIRAGDVLVSTTRPNLNAVAKVPKTLHEQICSTGFCVLRAKPDVIHSDYLFAFVRSRDFVESLSALTKGALYPAVTESQVRQRSLPLPPLPEQRRIIAALSERMAAVDRARTAAEAQLEAAETLPFATIRSLLNAPDSRAWPEKRLDEVCEIEMGQSPPGETYNETGLGEPLLNGPTEFGEVHPVARQWTTQPARFAEAGDILFCVRGATTGRTNLADRRYCIGRGLAAIRGRGGQATTEFLRLVLRFVVGQLLREAGGSTFPNLPGEKLASFRVRVPHPSRQQDIVTMAATQLGLAERLAKSLRMQFDAVNALPAALLRQAFRGELSPPDPEWERMVAAAALILEVAAGWPHFARVVLVKMLFLADAHARARLGGRWRRWKFGPYDDRIPKLEAELARRGWFEAEAEPVDDTTPTRYRPLPKQPEAAAWSRRVLGADYERVERLIGMFADMKKRPAEVIATVYAAWNDLIAAGRRSPDAAAIHGEIRDRWLKERPLTGPEVAQAMAWMEQNDLTPDGGGPRTDRENGEN
jgi:type I restriction enzyme S subunit